MNFFYFHVNGISTHVNYKILTHKATLWEILACCFQLSQPNCKTPSVLYFLFFITCRVLDPPGMLPKQVTVCEGTSQHCGPSCHFTLFSVFCGGWAQGGNFFKYYKFIKMPSPSQETVVIGRTGKVLRLIRMMRILRVFKVTVKKEYK